MRKGSIMAKVFLSCSEVREFLDDFIEDKLEPSRRRRFTLHLAICKKCQKYLSDYKAVVQNGQSAKDLAMPDELMDETLAFLEQEGVLDKEP